MANPTLAQLRTRARERANMENSTFVTDAEFNMYINYSITSLRDKMIAKAGEEYFADIEPYTLVDGQEAYALPADFYKILSLQIKADNNNYYAIKRFEYAEQSVGSYPLYYSLPDLRYRIRGDSLVFTPSLSIGGRQLRLIYVPLPPQLSNDSDTLTGFNGWDEYVVLYSAIKALQKEEQDVSDLKQELAVLDARIDTMSDNRDQSQPARVYDNSRRPYNLWWYR